MGENEIESLNIKVTADTAQAEQHIYRLVKRMTEWKGKLHETNVAVYETQTRFRDYTKDIKKTSEAFSQLEAIAKKFPKAMQGISSQQYERYGPYFIKEWANATTNDKLFKGMNLEQYEQFQEKASEIRGAFDQWKEHQEGLVTSFKHFRNNLDKLFPGLKKFDGMLKRFLTYRILRSIFNEITKGLSEGIGNLYQYSKYFGTDFAGAMDRASTSLLYLRNSIAAAAGPLIEMLIPYLERLVDWVVTGVNWLNQFFSVIAGKDTWTKAVKVTKEYADQSKEVTEATQEEAKAVKSLISGLDELNILEDASAKSKAATSAVTGANPSPLTMFEDVTMEIASESAKKWGERIKGIIEGIKKVMDDLGITFEDILKTAGLIAVALLGWKLATGFIDTIAGLVKNFETLKVPIGVAMMITGATIALDAMYDIGSGEITPWNVLKTIIGDGLVVGGTYLALGSVMGPWALVLGVGLALTVDAIGFVLGKVASMKEEWQNSDAYKQLTAKIADAESKIEEAMEIKIHVKTLLQEYSDLEDKFDDIHKWIVRAFELNETENKTLEQTTELENIVQRLRDEGIEIQFENGQIISTRQEVEKLFDALRNTTLLEALRRQWNAAFDDIVKAERNVTVSQEQLNIATKEYQVYARQLNTRMDETIGIFGHGVYTLGEYLNITYGVQDANDLTSEQLQELASHTSMFNQQTYQSISDLALAKEAMDKYDAAAKQNQEALDKATEAADYFNKKIAELKNATKEELLLKISTEMDDSSYDKFLRKLETLDYDKQVAILKKKATGNPTSNFASGGFPDAGSLFVAREAGPELVGQIGRRTAVANNDQIVEGIAGGVRNANSDVVNALYAAASQIVRAVNDKDTNVVLDGQKVSEAVTKNQNRANRMYGATLQNV